VAIGGHTTLTGFAHPLQRLVTVAANAVAPEIAQRQIVGGARVFAGDVGKRCQAARFLGVVVMSSVKRGAVARPIRATGVVTDADGGRGSLSAGHTSHQPPATQKSAGFSWGESQSIKRLEGNPQYALVKMLL